MGDKPNWTRKHFLYFLAVGGLIAAFNIVSCSQVQNRIETVRANRLVTQYRGNLASGFYETVIIQSKRILEENDTRRPADVAYYALGEAYVQHDFAGKDYDLSRYYFEQLINKFPESPLASEAKNFVSLFEKLDVKKEQIVELEKKQESTLQPRILVKDRNFEDAVQTNLRILKQKDQESPKDGALYNLGLIYAHIDNPAKDYKKSKTYFKELTEKFPGSPLAGEARIWLGLFEVFEKMQQIDMEIEEQKKQLTR